MRLCLVDRRTGADPDMSDFQGERWAQLGRLAAVVGGQDWPVDLVLVSDEEIATLNRQYRQVAAVTDVLSFSYLLSTGTGACDLIRGEAHAAVDLWREVLPGGADLSDAVGELVLAPDFVADRCRASGWLLATEIPWLVVHGCLHLVGWDHEEPGERQAMQDIEADILAGEGLPHPLRRRS